MQDRWLIGYDNDMGDNDESFNEWWTISNTSEPIRTFICNNIDDARWLRNMLEAHRSAEVAKCV